jgi:predicted ATP-grasp superfamily ATP-dependent carboligase
MGDTDFVELGPIDLNNPLLISGFTGPGLIGPTVLTYIIDQLALPQVGYFKSRLFPPITRIIKGVPQSPIRIYTDNKRNLILMVSDVFLQNDFTNIVGSDIFDWCLEWEVSEILSINGMAFIETPNMGNLCFGYSTGKSRYLNHNTIKQLNDGVISGLDSVLLQKSIEHNKLWTTILTTTPKVSALDPQAVIVNLELIDKIFRFKVDLGKIKNEFKAMRLRT